MPLSLAKHNQEVCQFLHARTKYNDWIVTTAFYSAIHYVYYKIFPLEFVDSSDIKRRFSNFKDYCRFYHYSDFKHEVTEDLVSEHLPSIYAEFKTLKDNCRTARYDDYQVKDEIVHLCVKGLQKISDSCQKESVSSIAVRTSKRPRIGKSLK